MTHKYLLAAVILSLGAGCLALAKQQKSLPPNPQAKASNPANATDRTATHWESAESKSWREAFKHSEQIAKQGQTALDHKRYAEAATLFRKAIAVQSQNPEAWLLLAEACERQGKWEEALPAYLHIVYAQDGGSIGSDPITVMRYVLALVRSNRYDEAVAVYDLAQKEAIREQEANVFPLRFDAANPNENRLQAAAHYVMGIKHPQHHSIALGELRQHLEAAIRLAPDWGKPHAALGEMLERNHLAPQMAAEAEYAKAQQLGEPVESFKQKYARFDAEAQRQFDELHPETRNKHYAMFQRPITPEEYAHVVAKAQASIPEGLRRQAEAKKKLEAEATKKAEDARKSQDAKKAEDGVQPKR